MLVNIIEGITINTWGTNQPGTKEHIFTKVLVECFNYGPIFKFESSKESRTITITQY